jgi:hypothetical protein
VPRSITALNQQDVPEGCIEMVFAVMKGNAVYGRRRAAK